MRKFTPRRALSTVVTSAILLTAVAVIGSALVGWSNSNLRVFETSLSNSSSTKVNTFNEFLSIENVWFCHNPPSSSEPCHPVPATYPAVNMTITNIGSVGLQIAQIQINNNQPFSNINVALSPGTSYLVAKTYTWQSKVPITITVTTARGSIFQTQVTPP